MPTIEGIRYDEYDLREIEDRGTFERATDRYFKPKSFERSGRLYEALGVRYAKKIVMGTFGKARKIAGDGERTSNYFIGQGFNRNLRSLKKFELYTRVNETIHAPQIIWNSYNLGKNIVEGNYGAAAIYAGILLVNTYMTMLQRYNRARIYNTIDEAKEKLEEKS